MIHIQEKKTCTGCGACASACPVSCIQMKPDEEGFLYPQVDKQQCVDCGKCDSVCPVPHAPEVGNAGIAYAAQTTDDGIRSESSSGGVFSEIAQSILEQGGVVFGAAFDEDFSVKHICVDSVERLDKLRGSKYVQSRIGQTYCRAKEYLQKGRLVLFTGTPCQIAGLHSFLRKEYDNLYTQDIICHGAPSPAVWDRYVKFREKKAGDKTKSVCFRDKTNGWRSYDICFTFQSGAVYKQPISQDVYMQSFLKDFSLRPSCYACAFKSKDRCADITLADFWGVQNCNPQMDDNQGTSLIMIHSEKGSGLFSAVSKKLKFEITDKEKAITHNPAMIKSVPLKPERGQFMQDIFQINFSIIRKKYLQEKFIIRVKQKAKRLWKRILK